MAARNGGRICFRCFQRKDDNQRGAWLAPLSGTPRSESPGRYAFAPKWQTCFGVIVTSICSARSFRTAPRWWNLGRMPDEVADIQALAGLGWVDGRNVWMDLRWAGANTNRMRALAQERPLSSFRGAIPSPAASSRGSTSRAGTQRHRSNAPSLVEAIGQPAPRRMRSAKLPAAVTPIGYERSRRRPKPNCRQGCIPRSPGCARPEGGERRWRHRACRYG